MASSSTSTTVAVVRRLAGSSGCCSTRSRSGLLTTHAHTRRRTHKCAHSRHLSTSRPTHQDDSRPTHPPSSSGAFSSSSSSPSDPSIGPLRIIHPPSHLTSYFFPTHLRTHYLSLQSLFLELALIPTTVSSDILARIRYGWWREAIQACYDERNAGVNFAAGQMGIAAKRYKHPIVVELEKAIWDTGVLTTGGLVQDHFEAIIDAYENALSLQSSPPPLESLEATSERIYSRQFYLHLNLLGISSPNIDEVFSHLGKAVGILESILVLPSRLGIKVNTQGSNSPARIAKNRKPSLADSARGLSLPAEYLQRHNVVEEQVMRTGGAAQGFKDAVFDTATRANDYLITARSTISKDVQGGRVPAAARPALVGACVVPFLLARLEAYDFDPFVPAFRFEAKGQGWRLPWTMYKTGWTGRL